MPLDQGLEQAQLLEKQVQLYCALNELAKRKEKVLSLADVKALDDIIATEQALILNIGELEKRRFASQKELATAWGLTIDQLTLNAIVEHADEEMAARCRQAGQELAAVLVELKERNDRCQVVIKGALDVVQRSFFGIEIGRRRIMTQQRALETTGHNVANAKTEGYSRQEVILTTTSPYSYPGMGAGQRGTGVQAQDVRRIRDEFLDYQYRNEIKALGRWEVRQSPVTKD